MSMREKIIAEAVTWDGTPYQKLQCCKGAGGDCTSVLWAIYALFYPHPWEPYQRPPAPWAALMSPEWAWHTQTELLLGALRSMPGLAEIPLVEAQPGDFVVSGRPGGPAEHVAVLLPDAMVLHAIWHAGRMHHFQRERRHAALRKLERTAFRIEEAPGYAD